jgi:hypothetical protein
VDHAGMVGARGIRRLTLIPASASDESIRRYRLARLDEVALASPPDPSAEKRDAARPDARVAGSDEPPATDQY